ncbi:MAG: cation diffusion facilitator family transporter [Candidatus Omnitrophica bacterium]|nr:cation diffusion facilitator family transporter [Candidatus Omnitrophota bacterium]MDD5670711.1 cation diffusion facilitator family transporter [Candidatus Omnitrophota bacterium]
MHSHKHLRSDGRERRIIIAIVLNFVIAAAEIAGGFFAGSLSLVSDALHNFSDAVSLLISLAAVKLSKRKHTETSTFGYKRTEILAALFNASILIIVSFFLFKAVVERLLSPAVINVRVMLVVALLGFTANAIAVLLLRKDACRDMNIKSAYLHLALDSLSSAAVIAGGVCIFFFKAYWIDPALTVLIGLYVLKEGCSLVCDSLHILMQRTPKGIDPHLIQKEVQKIEGVRDIHHLHVWEITDGEIFLECHINLSSDLKISESCVIKTKLEELLSDKFNIDHCTFQFEYNSCRGVSLIK